MKKNKLYTVNPWNKNLFGTGGVTDDAPTSTINPPAQTPPPSEGTQGNTGTGNNNNGSGRNNALNQMGEWTSYGDMAAVAGNTLGNLISQGKTSVAGDVFDTIGSTGESIPVIGGFISGAAGLLGGLTNAAFSSKINQENVNKFNSQNAAQSRSTYGASSNEEVLANFLNSSNLGDVSKSEVGSDGWFSSKAKRKTRAINRERRIANAHNQAALNQSVGDLDFNKDYDLMTNYSALGGPINVFDDGGFSWNDWWNNKGGRKQTFGLFDFKRNNQERIANNKAIKNGTASRWGGKDNAAAYVNAGTNIINTAANWKDEEYNKKNLGSNAGMIASLGFDIANRIIEANTHRRPSLEETIGLAEGGPINTFASGGDYANIAASTVNLANNIAVQTNTRDTSGVEAKLKSASNYDFLGNSNNDLLSTWNTNHRQFNSSLTNRDLRDRTWAEDIMSGVQASVEGAQAGSAFGPLGTVIGAVVGGTSSGIGSLVGRHRAKKKKEKLIRDIDAANKRQIDTFDILKDNVDRSNDLNAKALDFAYGGELSPLSLGDYDSIDAPESHFQEGTVLEVDEEALQDLINKGYKIEQV